MAGEPEWPEDVLQPEYFTQSTSEPYDGSQNYTSYGTAGSGSSSYTGSANVTANSDGTSGLVPKTDDSGALDLWTVLACAGLCAIAAGLFTWVRSAGRRAAGR